MRQSQQDVPGAWHKRRETHFHLRPRRSPLLQRHPLLVALTLVASALLLGLSGLVGESLFPVFFLLDTPSLLLYLLLAFVLGTCGVLVGIIVMLEALDRYQLQPALVPQSKEHKV